VARRLIDLSELFSRKDPSGFGRLGRALAILD
jgi:hypothetical protein